ncbi:MAG: META domain-containing protein [Phycisphaerales bacterium]|jgi:putative lipoprotein
MHMTPLRHLAALLLVLVIAGCSSQPAWVETEKRAQTDPASLRTGTWVCVAMGGQGADPNQPLTLEFAPDGGVSGHSGVNRFAGSCTAGTGLLEFGSLASTKMGGSPERMARERRYLEALASVRGFSVQGGLLRLNDGGGKTVLEFSH